MRSRTSSTAPWKSGFAIGPRSSRRVAWVGFAKGLPHAIRNPLEVSSRYLFLAVPGGLDRWFDAVAQAHDAGNLDDALFRTLSDDFGLGWLE